MFEVSLDAQKKLSSQYLFQLSQNNDLGLNLTGADKLVMQPIGAEPEACTARLLVFAEGLNLEKLHAVKAALSGSLSLGAYRLHPHAATDKSLVFVAPVEAQAGQDVQARIEQVSTSLQVEIALLDATPSLAQPGLLLMDMDSTVIKVECIDEIAKLAGVGEKVAQVTEQAMQGQLDFATSLNSRVACLQGADQAMLEQVRNTLPLMPGLTRLVRRLQQQHWKIAIASGGFTYFADYLKDRLGLDAAVANQLGIEQGKLSGEVEGQIVDAKVKADTLLALAERWAIPASQTVAVGDGANDLLMMGKAALGVAYHAKPIVRQQADCAVRFGGLDSLLWMFECD